MRDLPEQGVLACAVAYRCVPSCWTTETPLGFVFFLGFFPRRRSLLLLFFWINDS
jgi:hypothetical protein